MVGKGLARSWIFRFRRDGKLHDYGLGPAHSVSLSAARQRAFECRAALYAGNNPVEVCQTRRLERVLAAAKAVTFENAAEQYIAAQAAGWAFARPCPNPDGIGGICPRKPGSHRTPRWREMDSNF